MILPALCELYDRLEADPDSDVAPLGWSRQKVSFCVVLNADGTPGGARGRIVEPRLVATADKSGKPGKPKPVVMTLPGQAKPSGSGVNPCFLWDNAAYMLGYKPEDQKPARTKECFEAFRDKHLALREEIDDERFTAVCRFLERWDPGSIESDEDTLATLAVSGFGVFRVLPHREYVHERSAIRAWLNAQDAGDAEDPSRGSAYSLINGRREVPARLHEPKIKGVFGAQSSGATLVSFNNDAFTSYGKSQGDNAPVGEADAFKYCTALNQLLATPGQRASVGDATVAWWSDGTAPEAELAFADLVADLPPAAQDPATNDRVKSAVASIARGDVPPELAGNTAPFYVLGLSPNAARLAVRFWWAGSVGEIARHLAEHQADLRLDPPPRWDERRVVSVRDIVRETARRHSGKPDYDTIPPKLAGEVARAVIFGLPIPRSVLSSVIRRTQTDADVSHARCAIVKSCVQRQRRLAAGRAAFEEVPVALDLNGPEPYQLGRLFAVLEKTQSDALGSVDATIRDRYFGSASSTPAAIMPRLVRLTQHHMGKLEGGRRVNREKLMQEIVSRVQRFPSHLNLEQQGLFQIGYYHQREDLYTKRPEADAASEEN